MVQNLVQSLLLIFLFCISTNSLFAQCSIENFTVEISDCQNNNTINATIDFDTTTPSAIGYQIITNTGFTVVQIDEFPFIISLDGNCVTDYFIEIKDLAVTDCEVSSSIGVLCCEIMCSIEAEITELECSDNQSILATIDYDIAGTHVDSLDFYNNNEYIYTLSLPESSNIELPSLGPVQNLVICDQGTTCCDTLDISDPCFCNIFNIHAAVMDCDEELEFYYLRVNFDTSSPSSDSFSIGRPENALGTHSYSDIPVRVGPISFDEDDNEIFILDQTDAFCFGFIPHITLDSCDAISCILTDLEAVSSIDCNGSGDATFTFSFNTSLESHGFEVIIDGQTFGPFDYGLSSYSIGPLPSDGISESLFQINDLGDSDCTISSTVVPTPCDCDFNNLSVTQFCNEDVLLSVLIDFDVTGAITDSFDMISNSTTNRYSYDNLPINVTGLPSENIELEIIDATNMACSLYVNETLNCVLDCQISNFEVQVLSCASLGFANLSFSFDYDDLPSDTVILSYNGIALGNYIVQDTGSHIIPLLEFDCDTDFNSFSLTSLSDETCTAEFPMPNIDCCTPCAINNNQIGITCLDNFQLSLLVDFDYDGDGSDIFELYFNEELYGSYSYDQVPLMADISSEGQGDIPYNIDFSLCSLTDTLSYDCSNECIVENIQIDTLTCDEGMFTASLNFDHSEDNDSFLLFVNELTNGTYALDDLPIEIGPFTGNGEIDYTFTISVIDTESCFGTFELGAIDCGPNAIDNSILSQINWSSIPTGILLQGISSFRELNLIDLNGRVLMKSKIRNDRFLIENRDRMNGLYFVRLQNNEGKIYIIKVIL